TRRSSDLDLRFQCSQLAARGGSPVNPFEKVPFDGLAEPESLLVAPALLEISASVYVTFVGLNGLDDFIEHFAGQRGCGQYTRLPCGFGHRKDAYSVHELTARFLRGGFVVAVRLRDHDDISHLHDSPLDALKLVAGARQRQEQEAVDHRM